MLNVFAFALLVLLSPTPCREEAEWELTVERLETALKENEDAPAIQEVRTLEVLFPNVEKKSDQQDIVEAVLKCLSERRPEGEQDLLHAALESFVKFGEYGEKAAFKSLKHPNLRKKPKLIATALLSLAQHQNPKYIDVFSDYMKDNELDVAEAAVEAFALYAGERERYRKAAVEVLIAEYAALEASNRPYAGRARSQNAGNTRVGGAHGDRERFNRLNKPFNATLRALTGQSIRGGSEWQRWYNKNKRKRWDPKED